ncbi:hypothetical protein AURDEDRAFT_168154 [Auricularia subglabra TFB-10046 SS5]|nr:hypothetical protein AURDEDRAFT_168154 [Auricularia subglabra TFB-10046 SS5]
MNTPTQQNTQPRIRKPSERGLASKEYQASEIAANGGKRKRTSKDKENIDEAARAAEDDAMFQLKTTPAASKKAVRFNPVAQVAKPAAPKALPGAGLAKAVAGAKAASNAGQKALAPAGSVAGGKNPKPPTKVSKGTPTSTGAPQQDVPAKEGNTAQESAVVQGQFAVPLPAGLAGQDGKKKRAPRAIARDLSDDRRALTVDANFAFRGLVATCFPFPSDKSKKTMFKGAWQYTLQENKKPSDTLPTTGEVQIVVARLEQMRGNVKTVARAGFARSYGFKTPIQRRLKTMMAANVALHDRLIVRDAFVYEDTAKREGLYHAPLIIDILINVWFVNRNDEGPAFAELFNPEEKGIKLETIALVLAAIRNCLDEWSTGELVEIPFSDRGYRKWYLHHLDRLQRYAKHKTLGAICARLRKDMYRAAMLRAGAVMPKISSEVGITDADLDAAAAFYEAGKEPSDTESESADEYPINEDTVPALPRKKAAQLLDDSELADGPEGTAQDDDDDQGVFDDLDPEARAELAADPHADEDDDMLTANPDAIAAAEDELFDFDINDNFERTGAGGEYDEEEEDAEDEGAVVEEEDDDDDLGPLPPFKRTRLW